MKDFGFWLLFAIVLIGLFFLLPDPFINTVKSVIFG